MNSNVGAILIVEDENIIAKDLQHRLEHLGYRVAGIAGSGADAVRKAAELKPGLVFMDIGLRGAVNGIAAAAEIRKTSDAGVMFLSAYGDEETLAQVQALQPDACLVKPLEEHALRDAMRAFVAHHPLPLRRNNPIAAPEGGRL